MKSYQGGVLFIDMLGFSALTNGHLTLGAVECEPWKVDPNRPFPHQLIAARILLAFRKSLMRTKNAFKAVKVAQLSDAAFLWSKDVGALADAGRYVMHEAALMGLLCRGGLAIGGVHEPNKVNNSLGAFIVGDAVTHAVAHEGKGKGMRIFTDQETARHVLKVRPAEIFSPLVDPLSGITIDEWQWYVPSPSLGQERDSNKLRSGVESLVGCHTMLRYSPKLSWSSSTSEGRRQIACSVVAVSDAMERLSGNRGNFGFSVEHLMLANQERSERTRQRIHQEFVEELLMAVQPKKQR
jgi:hypothetical protein